MNPANDAGITAVLSHQITGSRKAWALSGVMLVQFTSVLASTIVANAAPTMVDELHGVDLYAWVFAGFTLAATICVPVVGKLSAVDGRDERTQPYECAADLASRRVAAASQRGVQALHRPAAD